MAFIAYYRVSTDKQGFCGLGIDAQRVAVFRHVGEGKLLAEYTEVESGKKHTNRPQLLAALHECRKKKATLVIAKLDRLGRNVAFISTLMEGSADFVCCDNPHATKLHLHIMAAFAEHEREQISERTKSALQQVRADLTRNGTRISKSGRVYSKLGSPHIQQARIKALEQIAKSKPAEKVLSLIRTLKAQGKSLRAIADDLNGLKVMAPRGGIWYATSIKNQLNSISESA